ncbi:TetR/AcrR family transcriptional regulator [Jannaschia aquimarina]|uniref:TetR/AcrR family transcriptional regulator n=1 Tax=Jannaschia aquimarina TaxID=935700 RepID=UPI001FCFFA40|nr:TetR/AcrR family transcriptional regulator [Jannaschia aquimarina]
MLEAIRTLIERDGADGFSIAEACRIAGVSTAAPYKHFSDRGDMLRGVALLAMERLYEAMKQAADAHPPGTTERIAALGQSYIDFARAEPGTFRLMFGLSEDHADDAELTHQGDLANALVERVVADHLGIDPTSDEARLRAYALWCFVHGHSFLSIDGKLKDHDIPEAALLTLVGQAMLPDRR